MLTLNYKTVPMARTNNAAHVNIVHWNANSLKDKYHEVSNFLCQYNIDILSVSETK